jgi:integrase
VDGDGQRVPLKTESARRTVEYRDRALCSSKSRASERGSSTDSAFVFATVTGKPYDRRNVLRELRRAMKAARDTEGRPTFPVLHEPGPVPPRSVPTFHGFRHTAASEAIAAGEGAEEVSWQLGHKNSTVTRAIYVQQIRSAEQRAKRRDRMEARYGSVLEAAGRSGSQDPEADTVEVVDLEQVRSAAQ